MYLKNYQYWNESFICIYKYILLSKNDIYINKINCLIRNACETEQILPFATRYWQNFLDNNENSILQCTKDAANKLIELILYCLVFDKPFQFLQSQTNISLFRNGRKHYSRKIWYNNTEQINFICRIRVSVLIH